MKLLLGYHYNCGGTVRHTLVKYTRKKDSSKGIYCPIICTSCRSTVPLHHIVSERPIFNRQNTCGVKMKRPKYDIRSWSQVSDGSEPVRIGVNQQGVLQSLKTHGSWHSMCGWLWKTHNGTILILETLVRRGLVVKTKERMRWAKNWCERDVYRLKTPVP